MQIETPIHHTPRSSPAGPSTTGRFAGHGRRHVRMGHRAAQRRRAAGRRAQRPHPADLRRLARRGRRAPRTQRPGDTEAAKEKLAKIKAAFSTLGLDRSRPHRPPRAHLQRPLQQPRAAAFRRQPSAAARRQRASSASTTTRSASSGGSSPQARPTSPTPSAPARPSASPPR